MPGTEIRYAIPVLGLWMLVFPATFGSGNEALTLSALYSGALLIVFGFLSVKRVWAAWCVCGVGLWLQTAPLLFWAPHAAVYLNDTVVGMLAIACAVLLPKMPSPCPEGASLMPRGWSYNPSSWTQRAPIIVLALTGWFIARYLAAYQLGYIHEVWDPLFQDGTLEVVTSQISRDFPVSDAGLGAFAYSLELLMVCKGDASRWCSMPWIVVGFAFLVVPLGLVSIVLIILQPVVVGAWCFLCLAAAGAMLLMIALTLDEAVAVVRLLRRRRGPFWKVFWHGEIPQGAVSEPEKPHCSFLAMMRGVTPSWHALLAVLGGVWLMTAPFFFGTESLFADSDHIAGALAIVAATVSMADVARACRYALVPLGLWLVLSPWFLPGGTAAGMAHSALVGAFFIACARPFSRKPFA
jgi:hypothetical protein